jgi:hypothetical protein
MKRALILAAIMAFSTSASAKTALVGPNGAKAKRAKADLSALLADLDELIFESELAGDEPRPAKAKALQAWIASRSKESGVDLVVVAELRGKKLRLSAYSGDRSIGEASFALNAKHALAGAAKGQAAEWLRSALAKAQAKGEPSAPATSPPEPLSQDEPEASPEPESSNTEVKAEIPPEPRGEGRGIFGFASPLAIVSIDLAGLSRGFGYNDPVTQNLRPYKAYFLPTVGARIELFPLAPAGSDALAGIGVFAGFARSFGSSARETGPSYPTSSGRLSIGGEYRLDLGAVVIVPQVSYESRTFGLDAAEDGSEESELPDVSYSGIEGRVGFELPIGESLSLLADGSFTRVMSTGEIISVRYHRSGRANAIGAAIGGRIGVSRDIDLDVGVRYQHYFFDFDPVPGDRFVAGGALDQYVTAAASIRVAL